MHTTKKNRVALVVGSEEVRLVVNVDRTNYIFLSVDQNAGQNYDKS